MSKLPVSVYAALMLTTSFISNAQTIERPKPPSPERQFYTLLSEDEVTDPIQLNGPIKEVTLDFEVFDSRGFVKYTRRIMTTLDRQKEITRQQITNNGVDEVNYIERFTQETDKIKGHKRITLIPEESENYSSEEFWYKKDQLVKHIYNDGTGGGSEEDYVYDRKGRLIQIRRFIYELLVNEDDELEAASKKETDVLLLTYKGDRLVSKESYSFWYEAINVEKLSYEYDDTGLCSQYQYAYKRYLESNLDWGKPLELKDYGELETVEGEEDMLTGAFEYSPKQMLQRFTLTDSRSGKTTEDYAIVQSTDQMTVNATFLDLASGDNSKAEYQYTYDQYLNPVSILSYGWEEGEKYLDKKTSLKVTYYE